MTAVAMGHHGLTVTDPDRTERFFVEVLGFRPGPRVELDERFSSEVSGVDGVTIIARFLEGPGVVVELLHYRGQGPAVARPRPADPGSAHLALYVEELARVVAHSASYGWRPAGRVVDITRGPRAGGLAVYLTDADGAVVELVQRPATPEAQA
jgi:catechol 2,3-dioxygenase-like lactoylglutathione lyase family enzyme